MICNGKGHDSDSTANWSTSPTITAIFAKYAASQSNLARRTAATESEKRSSKYPSARGDDCGPGDLADNERLLENIGKDQRIFLQGIAEVIKKKGLKVNTRQCMALEAGQFLQSTLKNQLLPFDAVVNQGRWEERAAAIRLANKRLKCKRNRRWRKKQRQHSAEALRKERERYEVADRRADEWRAREIAKDIARRKVEKMKEIAKIKAKEEKQRL